MNRELRLFVAIAAIIMLLAMAACGTEDERPARTNLTGTWDMETLNGIVLSSQETTLILNSDATMMWTDTNDVVRCDFMGYFGYAASKFILTFTSISDYGNDECNNKVDLNTPYEFSYFKEGSYLELAGWDGVYVFIKQ